MRQGEPEGFLASPHHGRGCKMSLLGWVIGAALLDDWCGQRESNPHSRLRGPKSCPFDDGHEMGGQFSR